MGSGYASGFGTRCGSNPGLGPAQLPSQVSTRDWSRIWAQAWLAEEHAPSPQNQSVGLALMGSRRLVGLVKLAVCFVRVDITGVLCPTGQHDWFSLVGLHGPIAADGLNRVVGPIGGASQVFESAWVGWVELVGLVRSGGRVGSFAVVLTHVLSFPHSARVFGETFTSLSARLGGGDFTFEKSLW